MVGLCEFFILLYSMNIFIKINVMSCKIMLNMKVAESGLKCVNTILMHTRK